jgi:hypothetical protein
MPATYSALPPENAVPPPENAALPPESGDSWQGRYVGTVTIGGVQYFGDALLTADALIRLYVGGPGGNDGLLQLIQRRHDYQHCR